MSDVGRGFDRDRTTVLYACHLVEVMRDDADFDRIVATMERIVGAAFRERGTI
jgi:chromosomal replication initiation ATPase DnaA